ncbi:unnamed protein product [Miscanthus lutarioriparius]|uniref:Uncharacterized protein n=1 Tax=Miscanthus lutarioriparius TaxID=422564 RepID=A0A811NT01_9POAL|nr:unnamed protein product [Miscanthus lutarioriparius]
METTGLSVGKSVLNGALSYAKSAIAQEVALQLGVQRDQAFTRDELEMMLSFLMAAHEERDNHKVVKTWVKQVRDVAYDVEDCLQDLAVRLGKPSRWCFLRTLVDRHRVVTRMKELRAKVEDVSQRRIATMFGIEEARRQKDKAKVDLSQLINEGNQDLRVIVVWGTGGVLGQTVVIKAAYDNLKRSKMFELYAWFRIVHTFNPLEFLQCIMRQFYQISFEETGETQEKTSIGAQVFKKMGITKQDDLVDAFSEHVNEKSYLIVLCDLSIEEWDVITGYFPDNKKGSRIIVSTEHGEVASLCAGQESTVSELNQSSVDHSIFASYNKESQVVGREKEKIDLINLISKQDDQQPIVISVWGMGGLGKTTLVKEIYQRQELGGLFEKRACVTIMRPFVLQEILESLAMQLDADSVGLGTQKVTGTEALIEVLDKVLARKRCLIVLDDLSSIREWDMIIQSLPKMESACRIIITTREENIARRCSQKPENIYKLKVLEDSDALDLLTKKVLIQNNLAAFVQLL